MDTETIVALVFVILFFGGAVGAEVYSRYQNRRGLGAVSPPKAPGLSDEEATRH